MKIAQINATCGIGSTGKICVAVSKLLTGKGIENKILYTGKKSDYKWGIHYASKEYLKVQALVSRLKGNYGFNSYAATRKLIAELEQMNPDMIHLHNLHGHNCNLGMLFHYLKKKKIKLFWTFHDCWGFTGYCPHFTMAGCRQWVTGCRKCPQFREFSWFWDRSGKLYREKQKLFTGLDLTIITPSKWMEKMVRESFLKGYETIVIHNGIDLDIFRPMDTNFKEAYGCKGKFVVLGVAMGWDLKKGIDTFLWLARELPAEFQIVLVGTNDAVDRTLPDGVISIHRTQNQQELAEIYSAADVFINPTREENYPTVNMEAIACGTPVITYKTGGSPEMIDDSCGIVVDCDDREMLKSEILKMKNNDRFSKKACRARAFAFDMEENFKEYLRLYGVDEI